MQWTDSQQKAIDIPVSDIIISAAAGSGKTAVMAERIINRLTGDDYVDIDKILVVTYTNAAASEIKERVMKKIVEKMSEIENEVLQKQLILLDNSHFCTIHSFCLELIKKYFYKLEIDPAVKTGDPADLKVYMEQAVSNVFNEFFSADDAVFKYLVNSYGGGKDINFERIILDIYNFSRTMPDSDTWLDNLVNSYSDENSEPQTYLVNYAKVALTYAKDKLEGAINLINNTNCCIEWLGNIQSEYASVCDAINSSNDYKSMHNTLSCIKFERVPTAKSVTDNETKLQIKTLRDSAKKEISDISEKYFTISPDNIKSDNENIVLYIKKIIEIVKKTGLEFDRIKRQKNIIDFADYEHMALKLLRNNDGTPTEISKIVSEEFEEIYIDEYQDCNNIQNTIFKYISGAIYGRPNMFCVGDMKQSIYKFRDANPLNFKYKCDNSQEYDGNTLNKSNKIFLNANFRSRKSVIDYVNSTFYQLMSHTCGELTYNDDEALSYGADYKDVNDDANIIDIDIINESNDFGDEITFSCNNNYSRQDSEVIHIANRIRNIVDSGYVLYDAKNKVTRKAKYSDIVVLFRSPADFISSIEKVFNDLKIPHTCDASSDFFNTEEIGFLVSLLKIIDNPDDDIALVTVLKNRIFGFDENMLLKIKLLTREDTFYNSFVKYASHQNDELGVKINNFVTKLNNYHQKSRYMELGDFILYLVKDLKYYAYLATFSDSEIRKNNVRIFVNKAREYDKDSFRGVYSFVRYLENILSSKNDIVAKSIGDDDIVRIMSIHKSKGLEFPIVFLSGTGKKYNTTDTNGRILLHKDLGIGMDAVYYDKAYRVPTITKLAIKQKIKLETMSEELRVLYVALTRPTEKLIITGCVKNGSSFLNSVQSNLNFVGYHISPHLVVKSKCFLETILLSSMRSEGFESAVFNKNNILISDGVSYNVQLINKCDIILDTSSDQILDWKLKFNSVTANYESINSVYNYKYPFGESCSIPGNLSVTEVKKLKNSDEEENNLFNEYGLERPKNFCNTAVLGGSVFGTLIHLCMEKLDLSQINTQSEVENQLTNFVNQGIISPDEKEAVDIDKIVKFSQSEIGKRISVSNNTLRREFSFKYLENASYILKTDVSDKLVIQGTIDAFFEDKDGNLVLIDYKTDKIRNGDISSVVDKYKVQLDCYANALESIMHKKVKEKIIYLFDVDEAISI